MLVGIAKLAAESERLESKRQVEYFELPARSLLNRTKPGMPFEWAINPYRGCEFGCRYCYARYTHEFMGMDDGREFEEHGTDKCVVTVYMGASQHHDEWSITASGHRFKDTYQVAARKALSALCQIYEVKVADTPIRYFPPWQRDRPV